MIQIKFNNATSVQLVTVGSPKAINYTLGSGSSPVFTCSDNFFSKNDQNYYCFAITGSNVQLSGVIDSVTKKQQFINLFKGQTAITDASELQLTASSMTEGCYANMFLDCTNLTTPPLTLPAINLDMWCYSSMFGNCSALTAVPTLPATNLAKYCYYAMFYGCKNIVEAPYLPAATLTDWCYNSMFYSCQKLTSISADFTAWSPSNATTNWVTGIDTNGMFYDESVSVDYGVDNIPPNWKTPVQIPLTFKAVNGPANIVLSSYGSPDAITLNYKKNDEQWTTYHVNDVIDLTSGETLAFSGNNNHFSKTFQNYYYFRMTGAVEAKGNIQSLMNFSDDCTSACYTRMFSGCNSLISPPSLPATGMATDCYRDIFTYTSITNAPFLPATTLADRCYNYMFQGCTNLTKAPSLPATGMAIQCYDHMFMGCSSLVTAPSLPATGMASDCYAYMFNSCKSLIDAPVLPASSLANHCYGFMFQGCTSLTGVPSSLPASWLSNRCYYRMFANCYNLSSVPTNFLPSQNLNTKCYYGIFNGCSSLLDAPQLPATNLASGCYKEMFLGCSSLTSINVSFTSWKIDQGLDNANTTNWVSGVAPTGIFTKPYNLYYYYGQDWIPSRSWTVVNK